MAVRWENAIKKDAMDQSVIFIKTGSEGEESEEELQDFVITAKLEVRETMKHKARRR